jgi:hypothetical protein
VSPAPPNPRVICARYAEPDRRRRAVRVVERRRWQWILLLTGSLEEVYEAAQAGCIRKEPFVISAFFCAIALIPDNTGAETSNYARYARSPGEGLNPPPFASNGIAVWKLERISGEVALRGGRPSWVKKRDISVPRNKSRTRSLSLSTER